METLQALARFFLKLHEILETFLVVVVPQETCSQATMTTSVRLITKPLLHREATLKRVARNSGVIIDDQRTSDHVASVAWLLPFL